MGVVEAFRNPDYRPCTRTVGSYTGGIRQQLSKVTVIRLTKLIFDYYFLFRGDVLGEDVKPVVPDCYFSFDQLKIDVDGFAQ